MFVDFFIKRPIFASVCAIVILLIRLISIPTLPIARFPEISPTQISVTSNYSKASAEVVKTLIEAVVLVVIVIFVFLQDWQTSLIPAFTIPLSLIGTFAFVKVFNLSINSLTLFGLTLASGMVVDDAIVVVEQISRFI